MQPIPTGLTLLIALGAAGTAYDLAILRIYPVLADRGAVPMLHWMSPDRQLGRRNDAVREAYEWARSSTANALNTFVSANMAFS